MKKNIDFKDEWINKNEVINALTDSNFDENEWINRLIAWGEMRQKWERTVQVKIYIVQVYATQED